LSTITNADRIVVIDGGKIIEQGPHADLLKLKGRYYELYRTGFQE
jgi:ABC-type multidrug transport system fused ATPase/permease subunit